MIISKAGWSLGGIISIGVARMLIHRAGFPEFTLLEVSIRSPDWTFYKLLVCCSDEARKPVTHWCHLLNNFEQIPFIPRFQNYPEAPRPAGGDLPSSLPAVCLGSLSQPE